MALAGEAGELLDAIKKHVIYNQPLDMANIEEEMGDIGFFSEGIANNLKLDWFKITRQNVKKLMKRYANGYSDAAAKERADKQ